MRQLLIFLMRFIKQMLFIPPQQAAWLMYCDMGRHTHRRSDRRVAMCVRPGSTDAHRRQAWVKRWGSGLCSLCWLSKQQRGQSEWKPSCKVISWRHICLDSEYLIKAKKKMFLFSFVLRAWLCFCYCAKCLRGLLLLRDVFTTQTLKCGFGCVIPLKPL